MKKLLIPLKLPFLVVRELLILVLKYCYGCPDRRSRRTK